MRAPTVELAVDSPSSCAWHAVHWEYARECSVSDATTTRGQALAAFAFGIGDFTECGAWKRWIRPFTLQEQWDDRRCPDDPPSPPPGWSSESSCWEFVPKGTPGAWEVWVCGLRADGAPPKPAAREAGDAT